MSSILSSGRTRRLAIVLLILTLLLAALPTAAFAAPAAAPMANGDYHVVKAGQTLSGIAKYYGITVNALAHANGIANPSRIYVGQKLYIPDVDYGNKDDYGHKGDYGYKGDDKDYGHDKNYGHDYGVACTTYHYFQKGDTLHGIGKWFGVSADALADVNGIDDHGAYYGQRLCIPSPYGKDHYKKSSYDDDYKDGHHGTYRVKRGDTLSQIARWYGVSIHHLMRINDLHNANIIVPGQVLRIG